MKLPPRLVLVLAALLIGAGPALAQSDTPPPATTPVPHGKKKSAAPDPAPSPAAPGSGPTAPLGAAPAASQPGVASPVIPKGPGPWDHDLVMERIPATDPMAGPGAPAAPVDTKVFERGGVATLARDSKGRLVAAFQWFPQLNAAAFDKIAIRTSSDEGKTWSGPRAVVFTGLPDGAVRPCDPTLVLLDDGRLRMYFTSHLPGEHPGTFSAVSPANDGLSFAFEPGVRFSDSGRDVLDCAVAKLGDTWHYFAPIDAPDAKGRHAAYHGTSVDGLSFERQPDLTIDAPQGVKGASKPMPLHRWLGCAVTASDGKTLHFYGTLDGASGLWAARSTNGLDWKLEEIAVKSGVDPAVVSLKDGSLLVLATSPPRPGTPSAKNRDPGDHR